MLRLLGAVLVVLAAGEGGARIVEGQVATPQLLWYDESTQLKVEQMAERGETSLVVAGTSMAWQGLVPSVLVDDGRAYNAGLAGGVPELMELWLTGPVVEALDPEVVLWGLSSLDFSDVYGEVGLDTYRQAPATRTGVLAAADRSVRRWSALIRQRPVLRDPSLLIDDGQVRTAERFNNAERTLGPSGERLDFEAAVSEDRAVEVKARISPFRADRDDIAAIVRTVADLKARGIDVILVELPVPPRFLALYDQGPFEHELVGDMIDAIGAEVDVPVISTTGVYFDDDFVDYTHLTAAGAAEFSAEVATGLRELGW